MWDDNQLVQEVLAGRTAAFQELVARYGPGAQYYFWSRCGENRETAEDLTQEAFLRAFRSLRTYQIGSSFRKWFRTICHHLAIDHAQSRRPSGPPGPPPPAVPPACPARLAVQRQIIEEALRLLTPRQREVFELKYLWDATVEEVAQTLDLPVGTVKTDLTQARRRLLEVLEEKGNL